MPLTQSLQTSLRIIRGNCPSRTQQPTNKTISTYLCPLLVRRSLSNFQKMLKKRPLFWPTVLASEQFIFCPQPLAEQRTQHNTTQRTTDGIAVDAEGAGAYLHSTLLVFGFPEGNDILLSPNLPRNIHKALTSLPEL